MLNKRNIIASFAGIGFFLVITPPKTIAKIPAHEEERVQFQQIDQPLELKAAVTLGGIGLIGLNLWWFLLSKSKAVKADRRN